ncbi:MAG: hypothetical protein CVT84_09330 [Alphaproteobacteria bacterium HGW-Alphaproteobacteria-6]|nr:MAG: hypothetical protein CVT84_09330 [Alphaproteobacteria bacterium HGW-Alphaproteobacteria-6]
MRVLIVESDPWLGRLWQRQLERFCAVVHLARSQDQAVAILAREPVGVIVLDLDIDRDRDGGSALAVADYASYRRPAARVVFVTDTTVFSDGSIFQHMPNACAFLPARARPEDLAAVVEHYGAMA